MTCLFLYQRALGIGAVQVNMSVFGAEQTLETKLASRYFDKYYLAVNIGATIATLSVSMIQDDSYKEINVNNYFYGYLIAFLMLITSGIIFILGYRYYIHIPPYESILLKFFPVIINACQTKRNFPHDQQIRNRTRGNSWNNRSTFSEEQISDNEKTISFLDYACLSNFGKFNDRTVNDMKSLYRAIVVFLLLIPYWIIYYQVYN